MKKIVSSTALAAALALTPQALAQDRGVKVSSTEQQHQGFLGVVVAKTSAEAPLVIKRVLEGGPAQGAGLLADDQILAIDEIDTDKLTLDEAVDHMRGPVGSWVTLAVLSGEDRFDLSIQRAPMVFEPGKVLR